MAGLHDVPTAAELVEAVREFLESDLLDSLDSRARFHTRVAINALAMVGRELDLAGTDVAEHQARLTELGYADDAALAAAIRSGAEDDRWAQVRELISHSVAAKLRVANPRYLEDSA